MGCCDSSGRKTDEEAKRQLDSLFVLNTGDFFRVGTQETLQKHYEILDEEMQSHSNVHTALVTDRATGETKFCKTIVKSEDMQWKQIEKTCNYMGKISHSVVLKTMEVYRGNDRIYLLSPSLKGTHKSLTQLAEPLNESQITRIIEKLLQMCVRLHRQGINIINLNPNNVFVDEDNTEDVLVTDVGFAYMPGVVSDSQMQQRFRAPEIRDKAGVELEKAIQDTPGNADIKSVSLIAMYLLLGDTEISIDEVEGEVSPEMLEFLQKTESDNPLSRLAADPCLRLPLFDNERLARQENDAN